MEKKIYKFLQQDINSLNLLEIIKKALKTLKAIVAFVGAIKNHDQNWSSTKKKYLAAAADTGHRNKGIKIKRLLPQTKNIEVKHRCRLV